MIRLCYQMIITILFVTVEGLCRFASLQGTD